MIKLILFLAVLMISFRSNAATAAFLIGFIVFLGIAIITMLVGLPAGFAVVLGVVGVIILVGLAVNRLKNLHVSEEQVRDSGKTN